jgi:DNA repair exonuclease SbcCD ATPase subunit
MSFNERSQISTTPTTPTKQSSKISITQNICPDCKNEIQSSSFFSFKKSDYCKYCGFTICANCINKSSIRNGKLICHTCDKKFKNCEIQMDFKSKFEKLELEIKEASQLSESTSLKYSLTSNEIENLKYELNELENDNENDSNKINIELSKLIKQREECDVECMEVSNSINYLIEEYKKVDKEYNEIEEERKRIIKEREELYKEFICKQDTLNKLNRENHELHTNLENYTSQINKRIVIDTHKELKIIFLEPLNTKKNTSNTQISKKSSSLKNDLKLKLFNL